MSDQPNPKGRFGTFGGVFTPSVLTILGVIMFMRAGYVVGHEGVYYALLILLLSKAITGLTSLSLSAIATNTEVGPGGNYFLISRSLGPAVGGSIGITLFISQAVAISFYVIGFVEALFGVLGPSLGTDTMAGLVNAKVPEFIASGTILLLFALTFKGAEVALRAQYIILAVLLASVAAFLIGGMLEFDSAQLSNNSSPMTGSVGFWAAFAIFFPAATGIDAGANMSGDLKDPAKSIPQGTLMAIVFTATIYVLLIILMAGFRPAEELAARPFESLQDMSLWGPLIIAGVFAATLSSALASFLGAPRILQAMGKDKLVRWFIPFAHGHGPNDEPRRATVLSLFIAVAIVWAGDLNAVAEVISMFFLIAYGMINVSGFVEGRSGNPSFRPRFKLFGWPAALAAAIGCGIAMVKINETYAIVAMLIAGGIYVSLKGRAGGDWADAKAGYIFAKTRENLFELQEAKTHAKNWRPILAAVTQDHTRDEQMIRCASWLENHRGLLSILEVVVDPDLDATERAALRAERSQVLADALTYKHITAFSETFVSRHDSTESIVQSYSMGKLRPNTILMTVPPPGAKHRREWLVSTLESIAPMEDKNVLLYKGARLDQMGRKRIDLWWAGERNGPLMAMYTYLVSRTDHWRNVKVTMIRVVKTGEDSIEAMRSTRKMTDQARLEMDVDVMVSDRPVMELIPERSGSADMVLIGLRREDLYDFGAYLDARDAMFAQLPPTLLVLSNGEVDLFA